jgi:hypothetical protein
MGRTGTVRLILVLSYQELIQRKTTIRVRRIDDFIGIGVMNDHPMAMQHPSRRQHMHTMSYDPKVFKNLTNISEGLL